MGAVLVVLFGSEIRKFLLMPGLEIPHGTIISAALVPPVALSDSPMIRQK